MVGLKRFEMNSPPQFRGVTEGNFRSIERRSLVVELRGQFVTKEVRDTMFPTGGAEEASLGVFV